MKNAEDRGRVSVGAGRASAPETTAECAAEVARPNGANADAMAESGKFEGKADDFITLLPLVGNGSVPIAARSASQRPRYRFHAACLR